MRDLYERRQRYEQARWRMIAGLLSLALLMAIWHITA